MTNFCSRCSSLVAQKSEPFNVLELYSGIGGMRYALQECGLQSLGLKVQFEAYDINTNANCVYEHNFGKSDLNQRNIVSLSAEEFDSVSIDLMTMSPPCQPFTRQGLKLDIEDCRSDSFVHVIEEVIPNMKLKPKHIFIENVKGFEESKARNMTIELLKRIGYDIKEFLLSPIDVGIPNSRLRYYMLAKLDSKICISDTETIHTSVPHLDLKQCCENCVNHYFPNIDGAKNEISFEKRTISDFIDPGLRNDEEKCNEYYLPDKLLNKYGTILDIVDYASDRSCCFTRGYGALVQGTGSVLKTNDRLSVSEVFAKIEKWTESETIEESERRIQILRTLKLRYFSPQEVSNLMSFPKSFSFPTNLTNRQKYKLLGNSVNISVISFLIKLLLLNFKQYCSHE
ncbi:tRNA (cytosine(38)-C(5))-methyltransferase-like protein [Leptotrombidium deliense]|uniref:tRNA (cytosine(38)-C(5))-methyltransferase n=1 Tax=Leptotrombidium deliense TaxID=299467 RepID=A0A443SFV1_9ACAR|nr:tRNA (cytosine(38)-C(5))-methyltransferase-like protein [Leptotrombidium deliense]